MSVVIDASAALGWLLPTQSTAAGDAFLRTDVQPRVAPAVFAWEVGNVLAARITKGRLSPDELPALREEWATFDIALAEDVPAEPLLPFAAAEGLSLFDAAYLALALELGAELASRDADLLAAARLHGVPVHDLRDP